MLRKIVTSFQKCSEKILLKEKLCQKNIKTQSNIFKIDINKFYHLKTGYLQENKRFNMIGSLNKKIEYLNSSQKQIKKQTKQLNPIKNIEQNNQNIASTSQTGQKEQISDSGNTKQINKVNNNGIDYMKIHQLNQQIIRNVQSKGTVQFPKQNKQIAQNKQSESNKYFSQQYIKKNLLQTKYFYSDILIVAQIVIKNLVNQINKYLPFTLEGEATSNDQVNNLSRDTYQHKVNQTYVHFILYVYHLYNKEVRSSFKEQINFILNYYINHMLYRPSDSFNIQEQTNLEFFVYIKKYLQSQSNYGQGLRTLQLQQKFCQILKNQYLTQKQYLSRYTAQILFKKRQTTIEQIISYASILQKYCITFPNIWIFTNSQITQKTNFYKHNNNQQQHQNNQIQKQKRLNYNNNKTHLKISNQIISIYDFFVQQFKILLQKTIKFWINAEYSENLPNSIPVNFLYRNYLTQKFKQQKLNKFLNQFTSIINKFHMIIMPPKNPIENNQLTGGNTKKSHQKQLINQYKTLTQKYNNKKTNILTYISNQKLSSGQQIKLMRIFILLKNILNFHTLRGLDHQFVGIYLQKLFQNNQQMILQSKDIQKKRQIKFLIGQLISKLTSSLWFDEEERLGKYLGTISYSNLYQSNYGKRDSRGEWYSLKK